MPRKSKSLTSLINKGQFHILKKAESYLKNCIIDIASQTEKDNHDSILAICQIAQHLQNVTQQLYPLSQQPKKGKTSEKKEHTNTHLCDKGSNDSTANQEDHASPGSSSPLRSESQTIAAEQPPKLGKSNATPQS